MSIPKESIILINKRKFTDYSDLVKYMKFILSNYTKGQDKDIKKLIKALKIFKESLVFGNNSGVYEYLLQEEFSSVCVNQLKACMDRNDRQVLTALLSCIITFTDNSKEMCEVLVDAGLPDTIICQTIFLEKMTTSSSSSTSLFPKPISDKKLMAQLILITVNIACDTRFQESFLQNSNISLFKEKLFPYLTDSDERLQILTLAALTWLIDCEEDKSRLDFNGDIILKFIGFIKKCMNDKERRYQGLRIDELLNVIQKLSNINSIKNTMIRMKTLINMIQEILKSKSSTNDEIKIALGILYNLSFKDMTEKHNEKDCVKFEDDCQIDIIVKPFCGSSEMPIKRYADGVVSQLEKKIKMRNSDIKYDIFVSFCHADRKRMQKIANLLERENFRIWIENENKTNLEEVEKSIHQSRILVMGVSNSYFHDQCCHSECQLAYKSNKPIIPVLVEPKYTAKDWLKKIIHMESVIDFSNESQFEDLMKILVKTIKDALKPGEEESKISKNVESLNLDKCCYEKKELKLWSKKEVFDWLESKNLTSVLKYFADLDGKMLDYLKKMKNTAPDQYYRRLKEDLKLPFDMETNFDCALCDLNE